MSENTLKPNIQTQIPFEFAVRKSNLLMEAKFDFNLWEIRIFERMVSTINTSDSSFKLIRLNIRDLLDFYTTKDNNDYWDVRQAANSLMDKKISIKYKDEYGEERWVNLNIMSGNTVPVKINKKTQGTAYIELKFNDDLKVHLLGLQECFKKYDVRNFSNLKSIYSFRFFFLLKQYENLKKRKLNISDMKELLCIEDKYPLYGDFKRRVINKAQNELKEHCDIRFEYEEIKNGRKTEVLNFDIKENIPAWKDGLKDKKNLKIQKEKEQAINKIFEQVKDWGVSKQDIDKCLKKSNLGQLQDAVNITERKNSKNEIKENIGGYFLRLATSDNLVDTEKKKIQEQTKKLQKKRDKAELKLKLEEEKNQLDISLSQQEIVIVTQLIDQENYNKDEVIDLAKKKAPMLSDRVERNKSLLENLQNGSARFMIKDAFYQLFPKEFEHLSPTREKINQLKDTIDRLG